MRREFVLVGGGLQNSLIALALLHRRPDARFALLERDALLGGNHTWCFHEADLPESMTEVVRPLVVHRWTGYDVYFDDKQFGIEDGYSAITSESLHAVVSRAFDAAPHAELRLESNVRDLSAERAITDAGEHFDAELIIDARGPHSLAADAGYQKFFGLDLRVAAPHGLLRPTLMDARVDQRDGYRFMYVLPLDERSLMVEDTYFSNTSQLDETASERAILDYCQARNWKVESVTRQERGCLPMPWSGRGPSPRPGEVLAAGYVGGWYHPGTGYSFPVAARLADHVATHGAAGTLGPTLQAMAKEQSKQMRFCRLLNNLMFRWYPPNRRHSIFKRFYGLPVELIRRFYALRLNFSDRWRLLLGRPPAGLSFGYRFGRRS